jgi:hypothetical protein
LYLLHNVGVIRNESRCTEGANMNDFLRNLWPQWEDQDIEEYVLVLAVILVLVFGTIRLFG